MYFLVYILLNIIIIIIYITNTIEYKNSILKNKCDSYIKYNSSLYSTMYNKGFSDKYIRKYFFTSLKKVYKKAYDENSIIIDIGSNKGDVTSLFNTIFPFCVIYSIEPLVNNYYYQKHLFKNKSNIKLFNYGISNKNKIEKIYSGKGVGYMYVKGETKNNNKTEQNK